MLFLPLFSYLAGEKTISNNNQIRLTVPRRNCWFLLTLHGFSLFLLGIHNMTVAFIASQYNFKVGFRTIYGAFSVFV